MAELGGQTDREPSVPDDLLDVLRTCLLRRDLEKLKDLVPSVESILMSTAPAAGTPTFLDYAARCIDFRWGLARLVKNRLATTRGPGDLRMTERVHLDIAEGLVAFHDAHYEVAIKWFRDASVIAVRIP